MLVRFSVLILVIAAFSACKAVRVERGEVPDEYRAAATRYMGTYSGPNGSLSVFINGRQVELSYLDHAGHPADILDARCESRIGRLQSVSLTPTGALQSATFAFDPNRCWGSVDARELKLDFASGRVRTSILLHGAASDGCRIDTGNPRTGIGPREVCGTTRAAYASKIFRK